MTKRRHRTLAGLTRLRRSVKRAHNALDLIIPELDAWRSRILALEARDRADFVALDDATEREAVDLAGVGWTCCPIILVAACAVEATTVHFRSSKWRLAGLRSKNFS